MDILIKSFIRKKTTKLFILIFSTLIFIILILFIFNKYYNNFINNIYNENTYYILKSNKNIYDKLLENKNISNLENVIVFEYASSSNGNYSKYLIDCENDYIIGISSNKVKLNINDIIVYSSIDNTSLEGNNISLIINGETWNFNIKKVYNSNFSRIYLNQNLFINLLNEQKTYYYTFNLKNYKLNIETIKKIDDVIDIKLVKKIDSDKTINTINKLENIIFILNIITIIVIISFLILLLIYIINFFNEGYRSNYCEYLIGFNKKYIKKLLLFEVNIIIILSLLFSFIVYIIIITILKYKFSINLNFININAIIISLLLFNIISILMLCLKNKM